MRTARELFYHELQDVYDAEHRLLLAMERMTEECEDDDLARGIREHRAQTAQHIRRLERVFSVMGESPSRQPCAGAQGLIEEYTRTIDRESPPQDVTDLVTAVAGMKAEHYEIVAYRSLIMGARMSGLEDAVPLLEENLHEEEMAAERLGMAADRIGMMMGADEAVFSGNGMLGGMLKTGARAVGELRERAGRFLEEAEDRGRDVVRSRAGTPRRTTTSGTRGGTRKKTVTRKTTARRPAARGTATKRTAGRPASRKTTTGRTSSRSTKARTSRTAASSGRTAATRKTPATRARKTSAAKRTRSR